MTVSVGDFLPACADGRAHRHRKTDSNMSPAWILTVTVSFSLLLFTTPSSSFLCTDGSYTHDGRECCLCASGLHLVQDCIKSPQDRQCRECPPEQYTSHPNNQRFCDHCTSCSHPNDNLEEDQPCTPARDRRCRCIKDHYCTSNTGICHLCYPCKRCGAEGIKAACTANSNTVCNEAIEENQTGKIVGIVVGSFLVFVALLGAVVLFWKKRQRHQNLDQETNRSGNDLELQALKNVDFQLYLPDIADVIGWKDMQDIAMRSNMGSATIDSFKLNSPGDSREQTLQLLRAWVEIQGRDAGKNLIKILHNIAKKSKAEKVSAILSCPAVL
ncbi:tumor necrosis factor receptor superfamily member 6 [Antennarius striatus]|uniref:tumor necrosis factor receptor superfamily member 6 n=1 Tax=Antennarius striatus TaxID=241820 RepID=UPI0035B29D1F